MENLRLQLELERYRKWYYGPRADRLRSPGELAQVLFDFAEELEQKPICPDDVPPKIEPEYELRRVQRRKGRRALANFDLPVTTKVYELSAEERACPCCGVERKEIGADQSWQIEYVPGRFERIQHVRKKYVCAGCEHAGENPRIEVAAKPEAAIEKGLAGPGLLAYIVTSKFSDYLPLYRLEDIFERQGFEISRALNLLDAKVSTGSSGGLNAEFGSQCWKFLCQCADLLSTTSRADRGEVQRLRKKGVAEDVKVA